MIDTLIFLSQRPIVIACALIGAVLVVAGSLTGTPRRPPDSGGGMPQRWQPGHPVETTGRSPDRENAWSRRLTTAGYAITFVSIGLFIVAGFVSDLRP